MGINWIENALSAGYLAVMARYLGPVLYGQWAYGTATYGLVIGLVGFGLDNLIVIRLGHDKQGAAEFIGLTLALRLVFLGLGAVGLAVYALTAGPDVASTIVLLLLIPALVGRGIALWARTCFVGYERVRDYVRIVILLRGTEAGCGVAYLVSGGGLLGVVLLHSLLWLCEAGCGLWLVHSRLTAYVPRLDWRPAAELLKQGAVLAIAVAADTWLVVGPIIILRHTSTTLTQLGQFAIVSSMTMIVVGSGSSFFAAALPALSRSARRAVSRAQSGIESYARLTAVVVCGAAAGAAAFGWTLGRPMAEWLLGTSYGPAGGLLAPFLLIGGAILAPIGYGQILILSGRLWSWAVANVGAGLWLAAILAPAVAAWNIEGAVLATAGAWLIRAAVLIGWGEIYIARKPQRSS